MQHIIHKDRRRIPPTPPTRAPAIVPVPATSAAPVMAGVVGVADRVPGTCSIVGVGVVDSVAEMVVVAEGVAVIVVAPVADSGAVAVAEDVVVDIVTVTVMEVVVDMVMVSDRRVVDTVGVEDTGGVRDGDVDLV